jgi:hypothetical protein
LRLDGRSYTPALRRRIVTLAGKLKSFEQAAIALDVAADVTISGRHIQHLTLEVGEDLARQRDAQAAQYRRRQLATQVPEPPPAAVLEVDGGRLGTRQSGAGPGAHQPQGKEDKIACLLSMRFQRYDADPQPEPPPAFRDSRRVARLVKQVRGQAVAPAAESPPPEPAAAEPAQGTLSEEPGRPRRLLRTCVASMKCSREFAPLVAAEAQRRGFYDALRQAFLGDGQK